MSAEDNKRLVARAVAEVINGGDLDAVDELYAPGIASAAREWVAPFRAAFPDVRMDTVALVGEGDTVVGQFRCSGTHTGTWMGRPPTGRAFRDVRPGHRAPSMRIAVHEQGGTPEVYVCRRCTLWMAARIGRL